MKQSTDDNLTCYQSFFVDDVLLHSYELQCPTPMTETQRIYAAGSYNNQSGTEKGQIQNFKFSTK